MARLNSSSSVRLQTPTTHLDAALREDLRAGNRLLLAGTEHLAVAMKELDSDAVLEEEIG